MESIKGKKPQFLDGFTSKCISGTAIEGNVIFPISTNEFITLDEREKITLRWYYDSDNCTLIEKFNKVEFSFNEFENMKLLSK